MHIWEDHFYPEVVDPETGRSLPDGEFGELVITTLTKQALPMVRYRTRDLTRLLPGTARSHRRIVKITGRSDDMLIIRGVNLFPSRIEEILLEDARLAPHYLLELRRPRQLDELAILVEATSEFAAAPETEQTRAAAEIGQRIKTLAGVSVEVRVVAPGRIERSLGKAKRIVDLRDRDGA